MSKQLRIALLLVVVISSTVFSAPPTAQRGYSTAGKSMQQVNANERAIREVERELETALKKGDSAMLDRILADDYVEIDAQGGLKKKTDVLELTRARSAAPRGKSVGPEITIDQVTIRIHGDAAAVIGRTTIRYQFMENASAPQTQSQTPPNINQERFIRSYSKIDGRWQLVTWQTTSIAKR